MLGVRGRGGVVSRGYWSLFRFQILRQDLGKFWGVWVFQIFSLKKVTLPWSHHIFKTQREIIFFYFVFKRKQSKKNLNIDYVWFYFKTALRNNFGPREVPQTENAWKWKGGFSTLGNSRGPKLIPTAVFFVKSYIITIKKKWSILS